MKCKKCEKEIPEGVTVCPNCGTKDSSKVLKIVLATVGVVAILAVLVCAVLYGMGISFLPRENDIYYKDSYTVKTEVLDENLDRVVATMGNQELTVGQLQIYYWETVSAFVNEYYMVLDSIGLDLTEPFDKQKAKDSDMTFQQFFLEMALDSWSKTAALLQLAEEDGFQLTEQQQAEIDSFRTTIEKVAKEAGYTDVEKFFDEQFFPGCSFQVYLDYNTVNYTAGAYYDQLCKNLIPTAEEIENYYKENEKTLVSNGYGKDAGNYYDVRHILIAIEGQKDAQGNYSEEAWQDCYDRAQEMLDEFLAGEATEAAFAALAKEHSADPGSKENGGLYAGLTKNTNFIANFKNWYLDESRQPGDTGIVKNTESSTQGYHIMFLSNRQPIWETEIRDMISQDRIYKLLQETVTTWPVEADFSKVILGHMDLV